MKNKTLLSIVFVITVIVILTVVILIFKKNNTSNEVPENFIAEFNGGVGEVTYKTYIYKIDNDHANYGFSYINETCHTERYGSPNWICNVTDKGEFDFTDGAFVVAEKNHAYSYVLLPNDSKAYSIEEFQKMFIMN